MIKNVIKEEKKKEKKIKKEIVKECLIKNSNMILMKRKNSKLSIKIKKGKNIDKENSKMMNLIEKEKKKKLENKWK